MAAVRLPLTHSPSAEYSAQTRSSSRPPPGPTRDSVTDTASSDLIGCSRIAAKQAPEPIIVDRTGLFRSQDADGFLLGKLPATIVVNVDLERANAIRCRVDHFDTNKTSQHGCLAMDTDF